jgi:hypothetical protein
VVCCRSRSFRRRCRQDNRWVSRSDSRGVGRGRVQRVPRSCRRWHGRNRGRRQRRQWTILRCVLGRTTRLFPPARSIRSSARRCCPVMTGRARFLEWITQVDVAHVLSWSEYPEHRADLSNVLALSKTHHAPFDPELFTIDQDYRLRVNPVFETESDVLQRTIVDREGERISIPEESLKLQYVKQHNSSLAWL